MIFTTALFDGRMAAGQKGIPRMRWIVVAVVWGARAFVGTKTVLKDASERQKTHRALFSI